MSREPGVETVGILMDHTPDLLVALLGVLEAGQCFVPLDGNHPEDRLAFQIRDAGIATIVTDLRHAERARRLAPRVICLETDLASEPEDLAGGLADPATSTWDGAPDGPCYVIYTSGSTGTPKGVLVDHTSFGELLQWSLPYFGLGPGSRVLQNLTYAFDFGTWELLSSVCSGATLYFAGDAGRRDLAGIPAVIDEHRIDTIHSTPSFFAELVATGVAMPGLRCVHLGGEELTGALIADASRLLDPDCVIYNGYGPTEVTVTSSIHAVAVRDGWPREARVPIGVASARNALHVLNARGEPVPDGVAGELWIGGEGVAVGYLGRPELTADRFRPDPFGPPGARIYRSGDLVRRRGDGALDFLGRIDHQVKLRGHRIEIGEIEAVLAGHPAVSAAAVVLAVDPAGGQRLCGYVSAPAGTDPGEIRAHARGRLPEYMVPAVITVLDRLPRTPNGKIDRRALPAAAPGRGRGDAGRPLSDTERAVADVWSAVLDVTELGPHDNFFELGGHSLKATLAISRLRDAFGVELPLYALFEAPDLASVARLIDDLRDSPRSGAAAAAADPVHAIGGNREAELLSRLDEMSDDEVARLLAELQPGRG
jgi:amino acid adenylation domain-containing protein